MSAGELQGECARRGLPSSRAAKATMVKRLTDHDAEQGADGGIIAGPAAEAAAEDTVLAPLTVAESVVPAEAMQDAQISPATAEAARAFRQTFDAEPGGPDEETHLAYRQATVQAAIDAGHQARGDARLTGTHDGLWVYEVAVRPGGPS